ncbi:hypothetical protein D3C71_351410 [compost metagenome]
MAILQRMSAEEICAEYTHYGRLYKVVPVYLGEPFGDAPKVAVRNWWPDWLLDVADWVWNVAASCMQSINPEFEHPGFMIAVDGEIRRP